MVDSDEHAACLQLENFLEKEIKDFSELDLDVVSQRQKLEASMQAKFSRIRALTRELELLVEELDTDEEQQQVAQLLTFHASEYNRLQQAFKSAALYRRQKALVSAQQERQQLLGSPDGGQHRRRQMTNDSDVISASEGITESLRRTRQIMAEEVAHTSATLATMEVSHAQLSKTRDEFVGQHSLLGRSKNLLRTIEWQNKSETWLLWFGLLLFALVSLYIAQKRVVYFVPEPLRPVALMKTALSMVYTRQRSDGKGGAGAIKKVTKIRDGDGIVMRRKTEIDSMPMSKGKITERQETPPLAAPQAPSRRRRRE